MSFKKTLLKSLLKIAITASTLASYQVSFAQTAAPAEAAAVSQSATQASNAPDVLIERVVKDVFATIKTEKIKANDTKRLVALVEQKILPNADIEATTKNVVGPAWAKATPEQKKQIIEEFKTLLIKTYAGALTKVGQQDVKFKPLRMLPTDTKVIIRTEVLDNGQANSIDYKLYKVGNQWKVYDLNILGVGLIATFKPDFAAQINKTGLDGLIASLKDRNKK